MKKTITLLTVAAIAAASGTSAGADTINGVQVTSNDGHTITLADGSIARIDGNHVYMDGIGEVILAPDIVPPAVPSQQAPQRQSTPQAPVQGVPTPKQETPQPIYQTPQVPETPQEPTKTPNQPLQQVENVPVKTYPQDNTPLPTQTAETFPVTVIEDRPNKSNITQGATETTQKPETFPTTTIKDTEKVEPIKVPTETAPIKTVSEPTKDAKPVEQIETIVSIAPQTPQKQADSIKTTSQPITPKPTQTLTQTPRLATAILPTTGTDDSLSNIATIVGVVIMLLASVGAFIARKENKHTKEFK
ncbi:LPXTG cell wall anchor domain-containing protein [Lactococcus kimchii]|uniref:LPXTG cell wall anchor domain-containing protein n=1 Tax=Lactococcus sp. S-13 TaxID=2507158 RepID=UPI001023B189|nr:hypothetical protein [Lactococcus sp. S-13]RZI48000.1 hypothetical protein EQJ87_00215 [Lactococcus sp. S-13]RZI49832.1 hypothetical protein EQJ87_10565 [Lactococcus sp. S-13]